MSDISITKTYGEVTDFAVFNNLITIDLNKKIFATGVTFNGKTYSASLPFTTITPLLTAEDIASIKKMVKIVKAKAINIEIIPDTLVSETEIANGF